MRRPSNCWRNTRRLGKPHAVPAGHQYLVGLYAGGTLETYLEATYGLSAVNPVPIISIVSEAELRVLAEENGWGAFKRRMLQTMLDYVRILPIPFAGSVDAYVAIETYSRRQGTTMGKNDLWIAATAHVAGADC